MNPAKFPGLPLDHPPPLAELVLRPLHTFHGVTYHDAPTSNLLFIVAAGVVHLNDHPVPILPGHLLFVPATVKRRYRFTRAPAPGEKLRQRAIHFQIGTQPPFPDDGPWLHLDAAHQFPALCSAFDDALCHFENNRPRSIAIIWELLWRIHDLSPVSKPHREIANPRVRAALRRIESSITAPPSMAVLAEELAISQTYLNRLFRESIGCTPFAYLQTRRKNLCEELLLHTDLPIRTVASHMAFDDLHHFNRTVRHYFGVGPRALRKMARRTPPTAP